MHTPRVLVPLVSLVLVVACGGDGKTTDTADASSGGSADDTSSSAGTSSGDDTAGSADATASGTAETSTDPTTGPGETSSTTLVTGETTDTSTADTGSTTGDPDGTCRGDADCDPNMFEFCFAPDESNCGACQGPDIECFGPNDCDVGFVCVPFVASCACDPSAMQCVQLLMCVSDVDCPDGQICDQNTCTPKTCDEQNFACPTHFDCVPDSQPDDHCVRHPCAVDGDCDGGFCVEGRCFDTLGSCMPPAP